MHPQFDDEQCGLFTLVFMVLLVLVGLNLDRWINAGN